MEKLGHIKLRRSRGQSIEIGKQTITVRGVSPGVVVLELAGRKMTKHKGDWIELDSGRVRVSKIGERAVQFYFEVPRSVAIWRSELDMARAV